MINNDYQINMDVSNHAMEVLYDKDQGSPISLFSFNFLSR